MDVRWGPIIWAAHVSCNNKPMFCRDAVWLASGAGTGAVAGAPECASPCTAAAQVVELMCMGADMKDEAIELQVLKGILTTASCSSFHVRSCSLARPLAARFHVATYRSRLWMVCALWGLWRCDCLWTFGRMQVHGEALLRVVTTCYNIFLGSRSEVRCGI